MIVQTPTPNINKSIEFYEQLLFEIYHQNDRTYATDGKVIIEINTNNKSRLGIKLYKNDWTQAVESLSNLTTVLRQNNGYLLTDTSGSKIYLIEEENPFNYDSINTPQSMLGNYAGVSLEVIDIKKAMAIWEILGFSKTMGSIEQGWVTCMNINKDGISFMTPNSCPHLFINPSLTYFNGKDNLSIIKDIRQTNIDILEEIRVFNENNIVDNIIIQDKGGLGFFLFSD